MKGNSLMFNNTYLTVRYAETDSMGVVHHSNYPVWFEIGRTEFFKNAGFTYSRMEHLGVLMPLINLKCSFKSPARYDEEIIVKTYLSEVSKTRIRFGYEVIRKSDEKILNIGETEHVFTNKDFVPVNLQKVLPEYYSAFDNLLRKE
jgi:acyl-CoA thioester hydrolase